MNMEIEGFTKETAKNWFWKLFQPLDELDKKYSLLVFEYPSNPPVDLIMGIFGHFFNRGYITTSILLSWLIGSFYFNTYLSKIGFQDITREINTVERLRIGFVFALIYGITLLEMLVLC